MGVDCCCCGSSLVLGSALGLLRFDLGFGFPVGDSGCRGNFWAEVSKSGWRAFTMDRKLLEFSTKRGSAARNCVTILEKWRWPPKPATLNAHHVYIFFSGHGKGQQFMQASYTCIHGLCPAGLPSTSE